MLRFILQIALVLNFACSSSEDDEDRRIREAVRKELKPMEAALNKRLDALQKDVEEMKAPPTAAPLPVQTPAAAEAPAEPAAKPDLGGGEKGEPGEITGGIPADDKPPTDYRKYRVKSAALNVRSGPSTEFGVVRVLKKGDVVEKLGSEGAWIKIAENEYVSLAYMTED